MYVRGSDWTYAHSGLGDDGDLGKSVHCLRLPKVKAVKGAQLPLVPHFVKDLHLFYLDIQNLIY